MRSASLFLFICLNGMLTGCGFFDFPDSDAFTSHDIGIANRSSVDLYVEYTSQNSAVDTTGNQTVINYSRIDSSLMIPKNDFAILFRREYDEPQRYGLEYDHIESLIVKLTIYQIQGNDTLVASPDLLDEQQWLYFNNDPLPFSPFHHSYLLQIKDEDFD
ncbi:MAG: hypothetical protein Roseis2KO_31700 [Roseivirga sp.]